jgi:hypothetical protein
MLNTELNELLELNLEEPSGYAIELDYCVEEHEYIYVVSKDGKIELAVTHRDLEVVQERVLFFCLEFGISI